MDKHPKNKINFLKTHNILFLFTKKQTIFTNSKYLYQFQ